MRQVYLTLEMMFLAFLAIMAPMPLFLKHIDTMWAMLCTTSNQAANWYKLSIYHLQNNTSIHENLTRMHVCVWVYKCTCVCVFV